MKASFAFSYLFDEQTQPPKQLFRGHHFFLLKAKRPAPKGKAGLFGSGERNGGGAGNDKDTLRLLVGKNDFLYPVPVSVVTNSTR
ncbi:MAG: hypothetical protein HGA87_02125 [Desulfobulbaceae bacterium]|nr:hypothetical protein [Desulfobulbaceae bacterium]